MWLILCLILTAVPSAYRYILCISLWYIQMPNHFSWTLDTHAKLENIVNVKLLIFLKLTYYSIIVELHIIGNHRFFVSVKLTYLIRDFVTNASILVIRLTIFPVFCFAMLKWSSLINFNKLDFAVQVGQMRVKTKSILKKILIALVFLLGVYPRTTEHFRSPWFIISYLLMHW